MPSPDWRETKDAQPIQDRSQDSPWLGTHFNNAQTDPLPAPEPRAAASLAPSLAQPCVLACYLARGGGKHKCKHP